MIFITPERSLFLKTQNGIHFISLNVILLCKAEGAYTKVFLEDEASVIISKHLITFEKILNEHGFIRAHRSFLINIWKEPFFESKNRILYIKYHWCPVKYI